MITMTCLIGVVVLPSLLPLCAAAVAIGAMVLTVIAQSATPQNSLYFRMCWVRMVLSNRVCLLRDAPAVRERYCRASVDQPRFGMSLSALWPKSNMSNRSPIAGLFTGTSGLSLAG